MFEISHNTWCWSIVHVTVVYPGPGHHESWYTVTLPRINTWESHLWMTPESRYRLNSASKKADIIHATDARLLSPGTGAYRFGNFKLHAQPWLVASVAISAGNWCYCTISSGHITCFFFSFFFKKNLEIIVQQVRTPLRCTAWAAGQNQTIY